MYKAVFTHVGVLHLVMSLNSTLVSCVHNSILHATYANDAFTALCQFKLPVPSLVHVLS